MVCVFCLKEETYQCNGRRIPFRHDEEVTSFVCSWCVQLLLNAPQEKLIKAYNLATEKGWMDKAYHLENFITKEDIAYDSETGEVRSNMVRKRPLRKIRPARYKIRT